MSAEVSPSVQRAFIVSWYQPICTNLAYCRVDFQPRKYDARASKNCSASKQPEPLHPAPHRADRLRFTHQPGVPIVTNHNVNNSNQRSHRDDVRHSTHKSPIRFVIWNGAIRFNFQSKKKALFTSSAASCFVHLLENYRLDRPLSSLCICLWV